MVSANVKRLSTLYQIHRAPWYAAIEETTICKLCPSNSWTSPSLSKWTRYFTFWEYKLRVRQVLLIMLDGSLEAYYIFIHPYFPILPPPVGIPQDNITPRYQNQIESFEQGFEPVSPVALAISSLLAPIPCPSDTDYQSHESVLFRRRYAHYQAQAAIESIETESEIPESSIAPHKALVDSPTGSIRESFHPSVPLEFEPIIALSLLSVYEYTQRGNLKKMQRRAGQALMLAIDLSLHCESEEDELSEVRRRVWWMTVSSVAATYQSQERLHL